jgi:undecaprenyl-phosphate galactose phosphotransferase
LIDAALVFLGKWQFSRLWLFTTWVFALVFVPLARVLIKRMMLRIGWWRRQTLILGVGENACEAAAALKGEPLMGLEVVAFMMPPGEETSASLDHCAAPLVQPVSPSVEGVMETLADMNYPHVIVALDADPSLEQQRLIRRLSVHYADLNVIPSVRGLPLLGMEMTHFFSHEVLMLRVRNNLGRLGPRLLKRMIDIVAASGLLLALSPLFAYLTWRIRQSGASAVYAHTRVGRGGKAFECLKFRSMVPDADEILLALLATNAAAKIEWERDFKLRDDPRITPVGAFLRRTSMDELPQLWNVLKGEMSLVGPRPVVEAELERYGDLQDYYLEARPGITGLWQISGRNDIDYSDRVNLDAWYVKNWSLWYDLVILLKTVKVVLRREGAY